jgi:hypothetical protein
MTRPRQRWCVIGPGEGTAAGIAGGLAETPDSRIVVAACGHATSPTSAASRRQTARWSLGQTTSMRTCPGRGVERNVSPSVSRSQRRHRTPGTRPEPGSPPAYANIQQVNWAPTRRVALCNVPSLLVPCANRGPAQGRAAPDAADKAQPGRCAPILFSNTSHGVENKIGQARPIAAGGVIRAGLKPGFAGTGPGTRTRLNPPDSRLPTPD